MAPVDRHEMAVRFANGRVLRVNVLIIVWLDEGSPEYVGRIDTLLLVEFWRLISSVLHAIFELPGLGVELAE